VKRGSPIKKGEEAIGSEVKVRVVKNKVAPPFKNATFELMFDGGISREGDLLNLGQEDKLIEKKGNWLYYGDLGLGNGAEKAREYLRENPALAEEITQKVLDKRGLLHAALVADNGTGDDEEPPEVAPAPAPRKGRQATSAD
jgi:recombination protein RecA